MEKMKHENEEIDLSKIYFLIKKKFRFIAYVTAVFLSFGILLILFSEKTYRASAIILPHTETNQAGGKLNGLASLAGVNLSEQSSNGIPPTLYSEIIKSYWFKIELLNSPINPSEAEEAMSYRDFYEQLYTPSIISKIKGVIFGFPSKLVSVFKSPKNAGNMNFTDIEGIYSITESDDALFNLVEQQMHLNLDQEAGYVEISFEMPEPRLAAQMTLVSKKLLEEFLIDFKIKKAREQLRFVQKSYSLKAEEYQKIKNDLANFKDRNKNISSAKAENELLELQTQYDIAYQTYIEFATRLEQAKTKVTEDTPVFTDIQPVVIPMSKASPRSVFVVFTSVYLGLILAIVYIIANEFLFKKLK